MMTEVCSACGEEADEDHFEVVDTDKGPRRKCPVENKWAKLVDKKEEGGTPVGVGIPDKYSMRIKAKARRFEGWIKSEPVGVSEGGGKKASDLIRQVMEAPSVLDNYDHLRMWIKEYFPQVKEPALNSFVEQLRMIDREYEGGPESAGGEGYRGGVSSEKLDSALKMAVQAGREGGSSPYAAARDKAIANLGEDLGGFVGDMRNIAKTVILEEAKNNPQFRQNLLRKFGPGIITRLGEEREEREKREKPGFEPDRRAERAAREIEEEQEKGREPSGEGPAVERKKGEEEEEKEKEQRVEDIFGEELTEES